MDRKVPLQARFSIITVCKNAEKSIAKTIKSLNSQPVDLFEWIVVDGLSTDNTLQLVQAETSISKTLISEADNGLYDAMNKGVLLARGEFLLFLNSDDWLEPGILHEVDACIQTNPGFDIYYGGLKAYFNYPDFEVVFPHNRLPTSMPAFQPAAFVRKSAVATTNWFDLKYRVAADFKFFKQLFYLNKKFMPTGLVITNYSTDGISSDNRKRIREMQAILIELGQPVLLSWLLCQRILLQEFIKNLKRRA